MLANLLMPNDARLARLMLDTIRDGVRQHTRVDKVEDQLADLHVPDDDLAMALGACQYVTKNPVPSDASDAGALWKLLVFSS